MQTASIDPFMLPDWDESVGARAFRYDAFLSHNRFDGSEELCRRLRSYGADVWHDAEIGLSDQRVVSGVSTGLLRSRFIVLNITRSFRCSPWTEAEYLAGLNLERQSASLTGSGEYSYLLIRLRLLFQRNSLNA